MSLRVSSPGQGTYTVTNLNAAGAGSFAEAVALSNSDGQDILAVSISEQDPAFCSLGPSELSHINKAGRTQFKLRFATDDDNDTTNDYLNLYDGFNATSRPKLDATWR